MRMILAAALLAAATAAHAVTFSTDASDLWFNPNESGWGVNVIHQGDTLFLTFFIYSQSNAPKWYVASAVTYTGTQGNSFVFSGPLYETAGPWFGNIVFNANNVTRREVGTATFTFQGVNAARLAYTIDGVTVSENIVRQTWRINDLRGDFLGAAIGTYAACPSGNGYSEEPSVYTVTQTENVVTIKATSLLTNETCTYTGPYLQSGRMGTSQGTVSCSNGASGSFLAFEIEGSITAVTARAITDFGSCNWQGRIGGLRRGN
jgi:hypothetical protein